MLRMSYNIAVLCLSLKILCVVYCQEHENWTRSQKLQMDSSDQCPPWHFFNATLSRCECYRSPSTNPIVKCTKDGVLLRYGYCMTHEDGQGFFVGHCNYFKVNSHNISSKDEYISLPDNVSELNDYICGPLKRKGVLCSECVDGFGPSITSIGFICSNCTDDWYGMPLYLFLEFVPITIFYLIVLLFRINVTSAPMIAFVLYCQMAVSTLVIMSNTYLFDTSFTYHYLNILITFYGIWNLDFFRYITPPFCVSPNIKPIHITFLYYISALYPICLIAMTWICIELHSKHFKPVIWLWNKFNKCFPKWNAKQDARNTIIDVFVTFFLLSYAKLAFTCFRTISYGIAFNIDSFSELKILHAKVDASVKYFGTEHLPFAVTAAAILVLVVLPLPLLLALYPIRIFRDSLLFKCGLSNRSLVVFNIFVSKFYRSCRDGQDSGRDMRSFICVHFALRLIVYYLSVDEILDNVHLSFTPVILLYVASGFLIAIVQPYKRTYMNTTETLILANLAILSLVIDKYSSQDDITSTSVVFYEIIGSIMSTIPLLGLTGVMIYMIIKKLAKMSTCCTKFLHSTTTNEEDIEASKNWFLDTVDNSESSHHNFLGITKNDEDLSYGTY